MLRALPAVVLGLCVAVASGAARADDAGRLALARELMAQTHEDDAVRGSLPLLIARMRQMLTQQGRTGEQTEDFLTRYQKRFAAEIGRFSETMAQAYAQAFTEDDLTTVIAFNKTPVGAKFIANRPALTMASFLAMQRFEDEVTKEVADEIASEKTDAAPPRKM